MASARSPLRIMLLILGLFAMIQHSSQLPSSNPLRNFIDRINLRQSGTIGLVLSTNTNEKALNESNAFVATYDVDIAGRRFHIGQIGSASVIYVVAGSGMINTAISVQIMLDTFVVDGIVYVGTSGAVNSTLSVGDVVVPKQVADTSAWTWLKYQGSYETLTKGGKLKIGDYNLPKAGENSLGSIEFNAIQVPSPNGTKTMFWLTADASWLKIAEGLQSTLKCAGGRKSNCPPESSNIYFGLRGVSSNIYVKNAAYGKFLNRQFKAAIVDKGTAPAAVAARSYGLKAIFISGVSNIVGGRKYKNGYLASVHAVNFATKFIQSVAGDTQKAYHEY